MIAYLFYILIFTVSLGQLGRIDLGSGVVINVSDVLLMIIVLIWGIKKNYRKDFKVFNNYLKLPIFIFVSVCLISLLINSLNLQILEITISSFYLVRWVIYSFVFFIVYSFNSDIKKNIIKILIISQILFIILGLVQYFLYPNLRNLYYLGWDEHLFRLFSTFLDPNFAATQINLFIFMLLSLTLTDYFKFLKRKTLLFIILGFSFVSLILTYSRSGYLMFVFGIVTALWMLDKKRFIVLGLGMLILGIAVVPKDLGSAGVELWRTASINARSKSAQQALIIIKDNPIFGIGFNSYRYVQKKYGFTDEKTWEVNHSGAGTDNSFLFVFATTGIIGIFGYLYLWIVILRRNYGNYKKKKDYSSDKVFSVITISSIVGLFINALFINSLFYPSIMFWIWTIIGLGESTLTKEKQI